MTIQELELAVRELGSTFMVHNAVHGSQYITINGFRYRLSDHFQPSNYVIRNYEDVSSYDQILQLVVAKIEKSKEINTVDEFIFDDDCDGFIENINYVK